MTIKKASAQKVQKWEKKNKGAGKKREYPIYFTTEL